MPITDPTDIAGLEGWYDASQTGTLTFNGTQYTRWNDASSAGNDIGMTNTSLAPTVGATLNSVTTLHFTGGASSANFLTLDPTHGSGYLSPSHTANTLTWFAVVSRTSTAESYGRIARFVDQGSDIDYTSDAFFTILRHGGTSNYPNVLRNNVFLAEAASDMGGSSAWLRIIVRFTGSQCELYVDGTLIDSAANSASFNFRDYEIGSLIEGGHQNVAEHGWYSTSISSVTDLDDYLETHWFGAPVVFDPPAPLWSYRSSIIRR